MQVVWRAPMTAAPQPQANIEGIIHDLRASGDPTEEIWAYEIESLRTRIAELEANEKAYEEIIGKKTFQEVADRIGELEGALRFYADEWRLNGDGDSETPGLSRSWMEPTDALHNDEGRKARDLVHPKDTAP
jgi:hypothetical protein